MDITGPYPLTPGRNKYLLTFVDYLSKYAETYAISEQTADVCARVYAREIVTRHGTGSVLVTDQGSAFKSPVFSETCKVLGIQRIYTSSYPEFQGTAERWHRTLHKVSFILLIPIRIGTFSYLFLMAYRAIPHTTTRYNPFYLLHGRHVAFRQR